MLYMKFSELFLTIIFTISITLKREMFLIEGKPVQNQSLSASIFFDQIVVSSHCTGIYVRLGLYSKRAIEQ
jgi:hypothetical protein